MDQWITDRCTTSNQLQSYCPGSSQRMEHEVKDSIAARKVQKADREKLRRDRLNEQFLELGKALDPDRPKNDKATILNDTVQVLKDLAAQVNRLKTEYASLSEESHELTQEKNELREEKSTLKSEIDNLNAQYQQRLQCMYPWGQMDTSLVMGPPPPYPFPMPMPISSGPIPMHPSIQPYPFFQPYSLAEQQPIQHAHNPRPSSNRSQTATREDSRSKASDRQQKSDTEKRRDYCDVATELELKTPGSTVPSSSRASHDQDSSSKETKGKPWPFGGEGSILSRSSSSSDLEDSSSVSAENGSVNTK